LKISEIVELLSCPDDNSSITLCENEFVCDKCKRKFHFQN